MFLRLEEERDEAGIPRPREVRLAQRRVVEDDLRMSRLPAIGETEEVVADPSRRKCGDRERPVEAVLWWSKTPAIASETVRIDVRRVSAS